MSKARELKKSNQLRRGVADERGFITLDFTFALMLAFGFAMVFFALSVTLSFVEVTQYVAFATARAYTAAHNTKEDQAELAKSKFAELTGHGMLKNIYSFGWFEISPPIVGDFNSNSGYDPGDGAPRTFLGARIQMDARILRLKIPYLGSTSNNDTTGKAMISAFLSREVSTKECIEQFNAARTKAIQALDPIYARAPMIPAALITDNGC